MRDASIAILGDFNPSSETHAATDAAISHSRAVLDVDLKSRWVATDAITEEILSTANGIWIAPGSPYRNMAAVLSAIRFARQNGVPCLGSCGGFQHMLLEVARNVLGIEDAEHAEYDPYASRIFISRLACSLAGREMGLRLKAGSMVASLYGCTEATERYYCNFGINPEYVERVKSGPLKVVGSDSEGEIRIVELPGHPYFVGTLFVPQARSTADHPHPVVSGFLKAVSQRA